MVVEKPPPALPAWLFWSFGYLDLFLKYHELLLLFY